ncbi:MAG: hypothetical protein EZS28_050670, partial [Streblomastix strix]
ILIFHSRIQVLKPDFVVVVQVLVLWKLNQKAGWPAELGAGGVNKLDCCVYYTPNVGELYMNCGKPSVMLGCLYNQILLPEEGWACWNRPGYGKP